MDIDSAWMNWLHYFPGVPIFFFISGYLIYQSYANIEKHRLAQFFTNRFLRLYPALWFCFVLTLGMLYLSGYMSTQDYSASEMVIWMVNQMTFFQFYNPAFLREFGVGVVNGSLWSIAVEIQFYALTPLLFYGLSKHKNAAYLLAVFFVAMAFLITHSHIEADLPRKLLGVSFAPLFYMFVFGAVLSTQKKLQQHILSLPVWFYFLLYVVVCTAMDFLNLGMGSKINPITFSALCPLVYKLAFTRPDWSFRLLKGNDVSYGVYIYHMPIVNLLIYLGMKGSASAYGLAMVATLTMAAISWFCIEKPCLKLKKRALRSYR